jgi:integrin alpha FG-GAP repeat containing protein 1
MLTAHYLLASALLVVCFLWVSSGTTASLLGPSGSRGPPSFPNGAAFSNATAYVSLDVLGRLQPLKLADLNADEYIDVLAIEPTTGRLYVSFWNHNLYRFGSPVLLAENVTHAITADFNGDGVSDVMAFTNAGTAALLLGSHSSNFSSGASVAVNANVSTAMLFSRYGDLLPDVLVPEGNGSFLVLTNRRKAKGTFQLSQWTPALCSIEKNITAFVDMNGDCLPDLVLLCSDGNGSSRLQPNPMPPRSREGPPQGPPSATGSGPQIAVWYSPGTGDILSSTTPSKVWTPFGGSLQVEQLLFADFTGSGTISILALTSNGGLSFVSNNHGNGGYGQRCNFHGSANLLNSVAVAISSSSGASNVPLRPSAQMVLVDYNYDAFPDLYVMNGSTGVILKNTAQKNSLAFQLQTQESFSALYNVSEPVVAAAYDTDQDGRQDLLISASDGIELWFNTISQTRNFLETAVQTAVSPYDNPRPFTESIGSTSIVAFQATNGLQLYACTQCPQSGSRQFISACQCFTGLNTMLNYVQEIAIGAGSSQRSWTNLLPNSFAIIYPQDPSNPNTWRLEFYTQRNLRSVIGVIIVLASAMILLGGIILFLLWREYCQDKQARLAREAYQSFGQYS